MHAKKKRISVYNIIFRFITFVRYVWYLSFIFQKITRKVEKDIYKLECFYYQNLKYCLL